MQFKALSLEEGMSF
uniref:Uncharacterized protein n=1 Tax=Anguilla anguilla TaxID=7936 RepID=A0A0E9UPD8_ANGAN